MGIQTQRPDKFLLGRYTEAITLFEKQELIARGAGDDLGKARAHELKAFVYAGLGDFDEAEMELQQCLDIRLSIFPEDSLRWYFIQNCISGFFDVKAGKTEPAKEKLRNAKQNLLAVKHKAIEVYSYWSALLEGEVALAESLPGEAIQKFRQATPPNPYYVNFQDPYTIPIFRDGLAKTYYATGELDKAIAEYQRLITFDPKSKDRFLINPKYRYRLAKLYEEKNWQGLAIQEYEKFLHIWKDADEDLPVLIDAKERLTKLKGKINS